MSSVSLYCQETAAEKPHSPKMRGKVVGKAFSSVSKQACVRNDPKKYGERWVGREIVLTGKGTTGGNKEILQN